MRDAALRDDIKKILETVVWAPSGDNSQPWEFYVTGNCITLANIPDRDNPILNYQQRGSYVAHGGAIENIIIAAAHHGWKCNLGFFPRSEIPYAIAEITLTLGEAEGIQNHEGLYECIPRRRTNRKPYSMRPLLDSETEQLVRAGQEATGNDGSFDIRFFDHPLTRRVMAEAGSSIEKVILENKELHHLLFKDVVWSESEERIKRHGLYAATMEFASPQKVAFWLASNRPLMRIFSAFGLPRKIAADDARLYATGAAMGVIIAKNNEPRDYVQAGRIMQRVWLTAAKMGFSIQPVSALLFAAGRIADGDTWTLTASQIETIKKNYEALGIAARVGDETIAMMFRIGLADAPSATSSRMEPIIHFF